MKSLLEDDLESVEFLNSLGPRSGLNQKHPNHLQYDLKSTAEPGKEPNFSGLKVGGVFCESQGDLCLQHAVLWKEIRVAF